MTYIAYLRKDGCSPAVVIDLFSRRILGWSLREQITSQIVVDALRIGRVTTLPRQEVQN